MNGSQPILELDNVGWQQQGVPILEDISWQLHAADRWAILGPNGSGKSSLLKLACGFHWPTTGVVRRFGKTLIDLSELRRTIGWVTSELVRAIPPSETTLDTVVSGPLGQVGLKRYGHSKPDPELFKRAKAMLESLSCGHLANRTFGVLSQGEKQQVLIARARLIEPVAIICDEPCAGMDPGVRERFLMWMDSVAADMDGPAWVLVTHHVEEIMPAFSQTVIINDGRIINQGQTCEVVTRSALESLYGANLVELTQSHGRRWPIWSTPSKLG